MSSQSFYPNSYMTLSANKVKSFFSQITFNLKDGSIIYATEGSNGDTHKHTIILIHGLASNKKMWHECSMYLVDLGYRTISLDLRHHGDNILDRSTFSIFP